MGSNSTNEQNIFTVSDLSYSEEDIDEFVKTIKSEGIVEIPCAVNSWVLDEAQAYIEDTAKAIQSDYFSLRASDMKPCVLTQIANSDDLSHFLDRVLE